VSIFIARTRGLVLCRRVAGKQENQSQNEEEERRSLLATSGPNWTREAVNRILLFGLITLLSVSRTRASLKAQGKNDTNSIVLECLIHLSNLLTWANK